MSPILPEFGQSISWNERENTKTTPQRKKKCITRNRILYLQFQITGPPLFADMKLR
jgi:hypothetical protein